MASVGSYGDGFARLFGAKQAPVFVNRSIQKSEIAVTYLRQDVPTFELTEPAPVEDTLLLSMGLLNYPNYTLWLEGKPVRTETVLAPQITMYDLRAKPTLHVNNPLVGLHFYMPRAAFDAVADNSGVARIGDLDFPRGRGIDDRAIYHLGMSLMPAFERPEEASKLFVDHVTLAATAQRWEARRP